MATPTINFSPVNIEKRAQADIRTGDTVRVNTKIVEKGKTRTQPFEGLVIARKHGTEPGATFTVRRTSGEYGVEKIFPLYSPNIESIELLRRSKVRQSNIYHVREKVAKQIRREMRRMRLMAESAVSESDEQAATEAEAANEEAKTESQDEQETQIDESPKPEAQEESSTDAEEAPQSDEPAPDDGTKEK